MSPIRDLMALILLRDLALPRAIVLGLVNERRARAAAGQPTSILALALDFRHVTPAQAALASAIYGRLAYRRRGDRQPLGYLLLEAGLVTGAQLCDALAAQRATGRLLGELLIERGVVSATMLGMFLNYQDGDLVA